jgi:hypothetical protein
MKKYKDQNTIKQAMKPVPATAVALLWLLASLFILGVFSSCSKQKYQGNWYTIKQGNHYSDGKIDKLYGRDNKKSKWIFEVEFEDNALYKDIDLANSANFLDVNKLIGYSDCGRWHSENSYRIGWRSNDSTIELLAYIRENSQFRFHTITTVLPNELITISIDYLDDKYIACINNICDTTERTCSDWSGRKYSLFPFFGGQETAPHDIRIWIKLLDS